MGNESATPWDEFCRHCATLPLGPVADVPALERLIAAAWDDLMGDDGGMESRKLFDRMEAVAWNTPILTFKIERHGSMVMGSTRAELQHWSVDVEKKTAKLVESGLRQIRPMAGRIHIKRMTEEILDAIRRGMKDNRLTWQGQNEVSVMTCEIFPKGSAVRMTLEGRRKRLRDGVARVLLKEGWERLANDSFRRRATGDEE